MLVLSPLLPVSYDCVEETGQEVKHVKHIMRLIPDYAAQFHPGLSDESMSGLVIASLVISSSSLSLATSDDEYSVHDIDCSLSPDSLSYSLTASLTKPRSFIGHPVFTDSKIVNSQDDQDCQIEQSRQDSSGYVDILQTKKS